MDDAEESSGPSGEERSRLEMRLGEETSEPSQNPSQMLMCEEEEVSSQLARRALANNGG